MSDEIQRDLDHPLYEWTQVVTHDELHALVQELYDTYTATPWWHFRDRMKLAGGFSTLKVLLMWVHGGKPYNVPFIQHNIGGTNEQDH